MMSSAVYLAAEDRLGLAIGRKLILESSPLTIYREENGHGYGTLKQKTTNFQQMARHMPVLMLTDLDNWPCPSVLISDWLGASPCKGFLFRVCVREVEAWLMADRDAVANLLHLSATRVPAQPETLADPKAQLIRLAKSAPKRIRIALSPTGTATIGPEYNDLLADFVETTWDPEVAARSAPSLARARTRLSQLAARVRKSSSHHQREQGVH